MKKKDITDQTDALRELSSEQLQNALREAAAPYLLEWDAEEHGTHLLGQDGRGIAFMLERVMEGNLPVVDALTAPDLTLQEERTVMQAVNRIAPILLELYSRYKDGRGTFDVFVMKPVHA